MHQAVGIGAGGHAKVLIDILTLSGQVTIVGLTDRDPSLWQTKVSGIPVLGDDGILPALLEQGTVHAFIGVGSIGRPNIRRSIYEHLNDLGFSLLPVVHSSAVIASTAVIGQGPMIMAGAIINPDARLGDNVIVNTGAIVEHDCCVESHVHISPGATLASTVYVGAGAHIGAGATIRQCIRIGTEAVVGAGAVVVKDVPPGATVVGVPAAPIKGRH